jgi:hypothetical protein
MNSFISLTRYLVSLLRGSSFYRARHRFLDGRAGVYQGAGLAGDFGLPGAGYFVSLIANHSALTEFF